MAAENSQNSRNTAKRAAPRAAFGLEQTVAAARPSRKSTRKAENRQKGGTAFERREMQRLYSPGKQHARRK